MLKVERFNVERAMEGPTVLHPEIHQHDYHMIIIMIEDDENDDDDITT